MADTFMRALVVASAAFLVASAAGLVWLAQSS